MTIEPPLYDEVTAFWRDAGPKRWFAKDSAFDDEIRERFGALSEAAARGELDDWGATAEGSFALVLLLDQFPRNLYRNSAEAFAADPKARRVAQHMVAHGFDRALEPILRPFVYLPFEHSEDPADQGKAIALFEAHARETGDEDSLKWARIHQDIITRFGRFPHRNACLGRESTPAEEAFLAGDGFKG